MVYAVVKLSCSPWSDDVDSSDGNVIVTQRAVPVSMVERLGAQSGLVLTRVGGGGVKEGGGNAGCEEGGEGRGR